MDIDNLVKMANDISNFFAADPDSEAATADMAEHLQKFWEPRMRQAITAYRRDGGLGLSELARAAIDRLPEASTPAPGIRV